MLSIYKTVAGYGEHEIVIERSRFIAYVQRVTSEKEATLFIEEIKKKHWDASHNCTAYLIGENDEIQKANDDGEPSGTAGRPMLDVLKKLGLKNTVVVVTRYFGGVKLGAGGLIRAYGQATKEGVLHTGIMERILHREVIATMDYTWHGKVVNEVNNKGIVIADTQFMELVTMNLLARIGEEDHVKELLTSMTNGQAKIELGAKRFLEQPYSPDTN